MEKVKPIELKKDLTVKELVGQMKHAGFGARKIGRASEIAQKMFADKDCTVFMGVAGAMVPAGMKKIFINLIREKKVNVLVTTGATLTHDLIEALGDSHYHCDAWNDDEFYKKGYDRMYNVLMKNDVYAKLEGFFEEHWDSLKDAGTIKEFLFKIGKLLPEKSESILRACVDSGAELYCPALADSGIGLMIWGRKAGGKKDIKIDAFEDMKDIIDIAWTSKKNGIIYIGGGTPKNFIQQSLQFSKGAVYGIQITQDSEAGGGSSGAPLVEGKSWGKLNEDAEFVDVRCDATIALPLVFSD